VARLGDGPLSHAYQQPLDTLWEGVARGEARARDRLLAAHYAEFRKIARRVLRDDAGTLAIQPTDLAHEAAIRILKLRRIDWRDRAHFLATSARIMRQTLIDEVRRHRASKRQAPAVLTVWREPGKSAAFDLEQFDAVLARLFEVDAERARVVELRFYAGLTLAEAAIALGVSESTVERRWRGARAWLLSALEADG
jgi:RNA polymerase sigma factor (TIGR02999 family)